ncbi:hypothetical protein BDZ89DRAFT_1080723, partial [Hymenopellis radicata]
MVAIVADHELGLPCKKSRYGFAQAQRSQVGWELRRPSRLERRQTRMCQWRGAGRVTEGAHGTNGKASYDHWPTTTTPVAVVRNSSRMVLKRRETSSRSPSMSKSAALVDGKREPAKSVNTFVVGSRNKQPNRVSETWGEKWRREWE